IDDALRRASRLRGDHAARAAGLRFSFDMLGEGARTAHDAQRYWNHYRHAIERVGRHAGAERPEEADGISIKLSALHPRFEDLQRARVLDELVPRLAELAVLAARANINLTIDAEESERLELTLDVFEAV